MAGDGRGATSLSFTMTLFPPVGSDTAEFGYTANISDGVVPAGTISALPVNPLESPSFKKAGASYKGGAETGIELTAGAGQIDENLLKLRDGAAELLAGLIKLNDGALQLEKGLAGEAAPGATRLADGAGALQSGLGELSAGSDKLAAGLKLIQGGLQTLDGAAGLPKAEAGAKALSEGIDRLLASLGDASTPGTLIYGVTQVSNGAAALKGGAAQIDGGLGDMATKLPAAKAGVDQL